ncbi:peroxisomal nicotinamide adenine dinucleotide carrier-like [Magnolia sinica]|uniref:peroxisomal nicotinamide adenine dinucleotide carrier-like n=1 Tax=Magnolia sinica TaxID=86752 RepID=UPI0026596206|nr:peroxisomal nicotinamide adenine dinucleotide carrier-like [Magnolia sinica]
MLKRRIIGPLYNVILMLKRRIFGCSHVSNPSMQFMLYETMLKQQKERRTLSKKATKGVTALEVFLLGAVAKLGATVVTYPLLVVKVTDFALSFSHLPHDATFSMCLSF